METGYTKVLKSAFDAIDEKSLNVLRKVARLQNYPKGTELCRQGVVEDKFYIIVDGSVVTTQRLENGKSRVIGTMGPNEYFGEMSLLDETPRMFSCTTLNDSAVLEITKDIFEELVRESPSVAYDLIKRVLKNLRHIDEIAIQDLRKKNVALKKAYEDLQVAQAKLVDKQRLERELELAAELQRSLLPGELPQYPDYRFAGYLKPAHKVGGDLFDVIQLDDRHVGLLVADVADKGIQAAMFMAVTRTLFYTEGRRSLSPSTVAEAVHMSMMDVAHSFNVFVTAFYGVLNRRKRELTYVRAGHDAPYWVRSKKTLERLMGEGRFLGMWEGLQLPEYKIRLEKGDRLVLFSDGVTDATTVEGEQYGTNRLEALLIDSMDREAPDLVQRIVAEVEAFQGDAGAFDDLTLLVTDVL
ncbi:MAG: SpoIIE family protein phosphatase [Desulfobacteraceae bacterium]|nr:SpoIIE family protein phosphatase [Desulfobacteraceae bacterium]